MSAQLTRFTRTASKRQNSGVLPAWLAGDSAHSFRALEPPPGLQSLVEPPPGLQTGMIAIAAPPGLEQMAGSPPVPGLPLACAHSCTTPPPSRIGKAAKKASAASGRDCATSCSDASDSTDDPGTSSCPFSSESELPTPPRLRADASVFVPMKFAPKEERLGPMPEVSKDTAAPGRTWGAAARAAMAPLPAWTWGPIARSEMVAVADEGATATAETTLVAAEERRPTYAFIAACAAAASSS
eukprot:TRINITY_DN83250_c0_g1_i1.p1 TRINITY_DN83250_c0_g1~~TRINITY_DN83250_c0_g1_i1.p1  ORF type:complete len:241 (+),score=44.93 TRINITY_DN83250_c0_g1_i1:125-847(+)